MLLLSRANLGSAKLHNANILLVVNQGWPKSSADFHCGGAADVMKLSFVSDSKIYLFVPLGFLVFSYFFRTPPFLVLSAFHPLVFVVLLSVWLDLNRAGGNISVLNTADSGCI